MARGRHSHIAHRLPIRPRVCRLSIPRLADSIRKRTSSCCNLHQTPDSTTRNKQSGTTLPFRIFLFNRLSIFFFWRPGILMEHPLLDEGLWRGPVGDLFVQRISTHVSFELLCAKGYRQRVSSRQSLGSTLIPTSFWCAWRLGAAVEAGRMFPGWWYESTNVRTVTWFSGERSDV